MLELMLILVLFFIPGSLIQIYLFWMDYREDFYRKDR